MKKQNSEFTFINQNTVNICVLLGMLKQLAVILRNTIVLTLTDVHSYLHTELIMSLYALKITLNFLPSLNRCKRYERSNSSYVTS